MRLIRRATGAPFVRRLSHPDSPVSLDSAADEPTPSDTGVHKKSLSSKMNNLMQKAKTYKRHSSLLRRGCNMSDSELDMPDFTSSDNDKSSKTGSKIMRNQFEDDVEEDFKQPTCAYKNEKELGGSMEEVKDSLSHNLFAVVGDLKKIQSPISTIAVSTTNPLDNNSITNSNEICNVENVTIKMPEILLETSSQACLQKLNSVYIDDLGDEDIFGNSANIDVNVPTLSIHETTEDVGDTELSVFLTTATTTTTTTTAAATTTVTTTVTRNLSASGVLWVTQQCLDLPNNPGYGSREDDDNRSQHSARTLSSSRRQSTEDSIDTDDEYFYYELRQLEEQEQQRAELSGIASGEPRDDNEVLFSQIGQLVQNDINGGDRFRSDVCKNDEEFTTFSPSESVKLRMSEVFSELKSVVNLQAGVFVHDTVEEFVVAKAAGEKFATVCDMHSAWQDVNGDFQVAASEMDSNDDAEMEEKDAGTEFYLHKKHRKLRRLKKKARERNVNISNGEASSSSSCLSENECEQKEHNRLFDQCITKFDAENEEKDRPIKSTASSETSGPDTPAEMSDVEISEAENCIEDDGNPSLDNPNFLLHLNEKSKPQFDKNLKNKPLEPAQSNTHSLENIKNELVPSQSPKKLISQESDFDGSQVIGSNGGAGLGSSKWKLLKTLKERKIEEKNNQDKIKEDELTKDKEKVIKAKFMTDNKNI